MEHCETTLVLAIDGCCVVSEHMLMSMLSLPVEPLEMCAEVVDALASRSRVLKADDPEVPFV